MKGFFSKSTLAQSQAPPPKEPRCGACGLFKTCLTPKMAPTGEGRRRVLIVAEAPGETEDREGEQLIGKAGQLLRDSLDKLGVDLDRDCWKTNALICRPPENRKPTEKEIQYCRPNVAKAIERYKPDTIIPLGDTAIRSVIGPLWKEKTGAVERWAGWQIPATNLGAALRKSSAWICPTYHPSYVLREERRPVVRLWFERHLERAFETAADGPPWPSGPPDYASLVRLLYDPEEIRQDLALFLAFGKPVAIDYETDRLKPDADDSRIVCAAVSNGARSIAYPWTPQTAEHTRVLLESKLPKIGANIKFEERWSRLDLGVEIRNWVWDTVVDGHILDNRSETSSVKFQAFVRLGLSLYNKHVEPFLKAKSARDRNNIFKADLRDVMLYCGLDALAEARLAKLQSQEMGVRLTGEKP